MNSSEQARFVLFCKLMFPQTQHAPVSAAQRPCHQNIARFVTGEFIFPKRAVACWFCSMLGTAMPETTIYEDCQLEFWKDEIRFAEDFLIPPPAGDFIPPETFCQRDLRILVPARPDTRHTNRSFCFGKKIGHLFGKLNRAIEHRKSQLNHAMSIRVLLFSASKLRGAAPNAKTKICGNFNERFSACKPSEQ